MKLERLGDIAEFINGAAFKPEDWGNEGKKIIRIQNLTDSSKPYNFTNRKVDNKYIVKKGDVLVSWSATIDVFTWEEEDALVNQHIFKVVFDTKRVLKKYFIFALKSTIDELSKFAHGSTMKHVVKKDFDNHRIPLPPLEDQIRIANILSKAEALISQRKESLRLLDELLKSTFLEMFGDPVRNEKGWDEYKLKEIAKVKIGPFGSLLHYEDYIENGIPLVNPTHIVNGKIKVDKTLTVSDQKMTELTSYKMKIGDIVLGRRGEIGRCAIVTKNEDGFLCGTGSIFLTPANKLDSTFLHYFISSAQIKKALESVAKGVTMKNLNSGNLENLIVPLPPLKLQTQFAHIVEKTEALKANYQTSLQELENLYGSLSQKAFKGELSLKGEGASYAEASEDTLAMAAEPETVYKKKKA